MQGGRRGKIPPDNSVARPYHITIYLAVRVKDRFRPPRHRFWSVFVRLKPFEGFWHEF